MNTLNRRRGGDNHKNQTYTINHSNQEQPSWAKQAAPLNPELTGKYDKKFSDILCKECEGMSRIKKYL